MRMAIVMLANINHDDSPCVSTYLQSTNWSSLEQCLGHFTKRHVSKWRRNFTKSCPLNGMTCRCLNKSARAVAVACFCVYETFINTQISKPRWRRVYEMYEKHNCASVVGAKCIMFPKINRFLFLDSMIQARNIWRAVARNHFGYWSTKGSWLLVSSTKLSGF